MNDLEQVWRHCLHNLLIISTVCFICGAGTARHVYNPSAHSTKPLLVSAAVLVTAGLVFLLASLLPDSDSAPGTGSDKGRGNWLAMAALLPVMVSAGFIHTWLALLPPASPNHIYNLVRENTILTLQGTVTGLVRQGQEKTSFTLSLSQVIKRNKLPANMQLAHGKVYLSMRDQPPPFLISGNKVLVLAKVHRIHNYQTPGTFDYVLYMRNRDITCSGWLRSANAILLLDTPAHLPLYHRLQRFRQHLGRFLDTRLDPVSAGLYQALLIGDKSRLESKTLEHFIASGCMHLLAISGLHLGLLGLALYQLFLFIGKRSTWLMLHGNVYSLAAALCLPPLILYTIIAGQGDPVLRALIMTMLVAAALLLRSQHSLLHLLAAAALVLLVARPLSLFTASFQLSFAAMLGILLFLPSLRASWNFFTIQQHKHSLIWLARWPTCAFALSLAATATTLPLLLLHFDRFSTIGPVMNLVIEPLLCLVALPLGLIGAICLPWFPALAAALFSLGSHGLVLANHLAELAAHLPMALLWTIKPSTSEITVYALILLLLGRSFIRGRWQYPAFAVLFLGLMLHFTAGLFVRNNSEAARVSFLDVGHGSSTLIEFTNGTTTLIDGGGSFSKHFNVGERIIAPFLWKKRHWRIDSLVITHPDSDHYNGLAFIIRHFHPAAIYINGQHDTSKGYAQLLRMIKKTGITPQTPMPGQLLQDDGNLCRLVSLGMPGLASDQDSDNNQSLVTRLHCANVSFLFPGDIEKRAEKRLLQQQVPVKAEVLLAPHHGSKTSFGSAFLQRVNPRLIVISGKKKSADFDRWLQPSVMKDNRPAILVTGRDGTITCATDGNQLQVSTWADNL